MDVNLQPCLDNIWIHYTLSDEYKLLLTVQNGNYSAKFEDFLKDVLHAIPCEASSVDDRWRIISKLCTDSEDIAADLALTDLQKLGNPMMAPAIPLLIDGDETVLENTPSIMKICWTLIQLRDFKPGIFYAINRRMNQVLGKITLSQAFRGIASEVLSLVSPDSVIDLSEFDIWHVNQGLEMGFRYPIVFQREDLCYCFQDKFAQLYEYPGALFANGDYLPLVNRAINEKRHLLDICLDEMNDCLNRSNEGAVAMTPFVKEYGLLPFYAATRSFQFYESVPNIRKILRMRDWTGTIMESVFPRLRNDCLLLDDVSTLTDNTELTLHDFADKSLPLILQYGLGNMDTILTWSTRKCFIISDNDLEEDFFFFKCYRVLQIYFRCFKNMSKAANRNLEIIRTLIDGITDIDHRNQIVLDLFSCIFVKEKGHLVCHPELARKVCGILADYNASKCISDTSAWLKGRKSQKGETSLEEYLSADLLELYQAVTEKKWDRANQLGSYFPSLRPLCVRAYILNHWQSFGKLPDDFKTDQPDTLLDAAFSTYNKSLWSDVHVSDANMRKMLRERQQQQTKEGILDPLPYQEKWAPAQEGMLAIDVNPYEFIGVEVRKRVHLANIAVSNNLGHYVNTLLLYFQNRSLYVSESPSDISEFFKFDIVKAVGGPFNLKNYTAAQQLSGLYHQDMFEIVIKHKNQFNICESFLDFGFNEHPFECLVLAYENGWCEWLESRKEKFREKAIERLIRDIKKEKKVIETSYDIEKVIQCLMRNENVDDMIYNCDFHDIYQRLLNIPIASYTVAAFRVLDIVSVAKESALEGEKEDTIRFWFRIRQWTKASHATSIVTDLMKAGQFEVAVEYLKKYAAADVCGPAVSQLFSLCLGDGEQVDTILKTFPERYDLLMSKFLHLPALVSHFMECCPPSRREHMIALSRLPLEVTLDSNVFDLPTVVDAFRRHPKCIYEITEHTSILFTDEQWLQMIDTEATPASQAELISFIYGFIKNPSVLDAFCLERICEVICQIEVQSTSDEEHCVMSCNRLRPILRMLRNKGPDIDRIQLLIDFVEARFYLHHRQAYSFGDFPSGDVGLRLLDYCYKYDLPEFSDRIATSFGLERQADEKAVERIGVMMIFCLHEEAHQQILERNLKLDNEGGLLVNDDEIWHLGVAGIVKSPIFDPQVLHQLSISDIDPEKVTNNIFVYQSIKMAVTLNPVKAQNSLMLWLLGHAVSMNTAICSLIHMKGYAAAYQMIMGIQDESKQAEAFIHSFYYAALSRDSEVVALEAFVKKQDPGLNLTSRLWKCLLSFFDEYDMGESKYRLLMYLNQFEDAIPVALQLFDKESNSKHKLAQLSHLLYCISQTLHGMESMDDSLSPPFIPKGIYSVVTLEKMSALCFLMQDAIQFCEQYKIPFKSEFNMLKSEATISLAALFVLHGEDYLFNRWCELAMVERHEVTASACGAMVDMPIDQLLKFLMSLRQKDPVFSNEVSLALLACLSQSEKRNVIATVIVTCFSDPRERCCLFIEYGYIAEALMSARECHAVDLIPMIGYQASMNGLRELVATCRNILMTI